MINTVQLSNDELQIRRTSTGGSSIIVKYGDIYYKLGRFYSYTPVGYETTLEVINSRLGQKMGLDVLRYQPIVITTTLMGHAIKVRGCFSKSFLKKGKRVF